jgi:hypothetical protein
VRKFAAEYEIPRVFEKLEDMVPEVDGAVIHGCDWDTHVEKARPFVEAGKAVLVDKPMAGNPRDLGQFLRWSSEGAKITGGSSLRFAPEVTAWLKIPVEKRGTPQTMFCGCGVDEFNYGIHAYSLMCGVMGPGAASARHLGDGPQRRIQVNWTDGRVGIVAVGETQKYLPFYASVTTGIQVHQFQVDSSRIYRALLEVALPYLANESGPPPVCLGELIEPELCALAARKSWNEGDRVVKLRELDDESDGYDGAAFAESYRKAKYS